MFNFISFPLPAFLNPMHNPLTYVLALVFLSLPPIFLGFSIFISGFKALLNLKPNMDSLISLGCVAAIAYSFISLFRILLGDLQGVNELYFESAALIISFVLLGRYLDGCSKALANKSFIQFS